MHISSLQLLCILGMNDASMQFGAEFDRHFSDVFVFIMRISFINGLKCGVKQLIRWTCSRSPWAATLLSQRQLQLEGEGEVGVHGLM